MRNFVPGSLWPAVESPRAASRPLQFWLNTRAAAAGGQGQHPPTAAFKEWAILRCP